MSGYPVRFSILLMAACVLTGSMAFAAVNDFDEEAPLTVAAGTPDKPGHRNYAGGRDDQNLEVQAAIPVPTRSLEGATVLAAPRAEEEAAHD